MLALTKTTRQMLERARDCAPINALEQVLATMPRVELPLQNDFTPGLYRRTVFIPKGTILTSKIHKTEHPFVITKGSILVWTEETGTLLFVAPFHGITKAGTRRILEALDDVIWTTYHVTDKTDVDEIERDIIFPHDIPSTNPPAELECTH